MTPKNVTKSMADRLKADGAEVEKKPQKRDPAPRSKIETDPRDEQIAALKSEIGELKDALLQSQNTAEARMHELMRALSEASDAKPLRVKPIRDMDRDSPTYLLVSHYDFVPVSYRKLDS